MLSIKGHILLVTGRSVLLRTGILAAAVLMAAGRVYAAGTTSVAVSATILSKSKCKFVTNSATLNFGAIDPSSAVNAAASATVQFVCNGSANPASYSISQNGGLYNSGGRNRMINTDGIHYLPYSISLSPASGTVPKSVNENLTVSGAVAVADFQSAQYGSYSDTVTLTITP